ncbi:MAG: nucleotidyltransferase domain-containing protein [Woeseiaceae bacterium]|nr:nucleotidyltransferase domain-containing protein [Woeseiaceae bacterium]
MQIRDHHQRAIDRLADAYREDPRFLAVIIGGSVAKGFAREDSDVDFLIVANDEEFERRMASRDLFINRRDLCDYEHGFVDGKIVNLDYLEAVAEQGNEPSRASFEGAFVAYSHIADLDTLLQRIPVYPEAGHDERIKAFYSMAFIQHWLFHEADRHGNRYTLTRAASQLALFAGRLILAHNKRLFPYHKWFPRVLESVPEKPDGFVACFDQLLSEPQADHATALFESIRDFRDWGVTDLDAYTWFMTDVEWAWMSGSTPLEDW